MSGANKIAYILIFILLINVTVTARADDEQLAVLNRYQELMEASYGTPEANCYADTLLMYARKYDGSDYLEYALTTKANNLQVLSLNEESNVFIDSVLNNFNFVLGYENRTYLRFLQILNHIELSHFRIATNLAQQLYNEAKQENADPALIVAHKRAQCWAQEGIGLANTEMGQYDEAIKNYEQAIEVVKDSPGDTLALSLLEAQTFLMQLVDRIDDTDKALYYLNDYREKLRLFRQNSKGRYYEEWLSTDDYLLSMYTVYTVTYCRRGEMKKAQETLAKADSVYAIGSMPESVVAEYYSAKAMYYEQADKYDVSIQYADSAAAVYQSMQKKNNQIRLLGVKMKSLFERGSYADVYPIALDILALKDSVSNERFKSSLAEMQTLQEVDKLEMKNQNLQNQQQILEARQNMWVVIAVATLLLALVLIFWLRRRQDLREKAILSHQKEELRRQVDEQTAELRKQKEDIERANQSITDSITYALHIQKSILPDFSQYAGGEGQVTNAFCFYVPCHIVSGDFYWAAKRNGKTLFACCDCTGHGVPGGFMSMLGTSVLGEIAQMPEADNLAEMLELTNEKLLQTLEQSGDKDSVDGMDMALMEYDPATSSISIASAARTSYLTINGVSFQHKGVKRGIGERGLDRENRPFEVETFEVKKGDRIFMCSDGFPDQFGGPRGKKFGTKGLGEALFAAKDVPFSEMYEFVKKTYYDYRGDCEQLDDITLMAIEI